jgi:hypothetical protein
MDGSDQLEGGRQAYARQAWGDAFAQLSAADAQSELEPADLERLAVAADLIGRDDDSAASGHHRAPGRKEARLIPPAERNATHAVRARHLRLRVPLPHGILR